jgi:uncharacterized membrane protein YjjP (DUF1212 family)
LYQDAIIDAPPLYPWWVRLLAFAVSAFSLTPLFFNGSWMDATVSMILGIFLLWFEFFS